MRKALFYLSFTLVIMHNMFRAISFVDADIFNIIYGVALAIFAFLGVLNFDKTNIKKVLWTSLITVFLIVFTVLFHDVFLLTIWLAIIAFRGIEFDKFVKYDLLLKIVCLLTVIVLYGFGLTNSGVVYDNGIEFYGMGFENPNVFSAYVMSIIIDWLYLRRYKLGLFEFLLVFVVSLIIIFWIGSRTQPIIMILTTLLLINNRKIKYGKSKNKLLRFSKNNIFSVMACISLLFVAIFINNPSSQVMQDFDNALSGRLRISARIIENYGVDFIGNDSFSKEVGEATIDNQYTYIAIFYGIIPLIIISIVMYRYMKFLDVRQKRAIYIIMFMFIVSGLVEKSCLRIQYNIFILCSSYMIYGDAIYQKYKNSRLSRARNGKKYLNKGKIEQNEE